MDLDQVYQKILVGLENGSRSLIRYSRDEIDELLVKMGEAVQASNYPQLEKVLCAIDHSAVDDSAFESSLLKVLALPLEPRLMVFALNCTRKHIIQARFKKGQRLQYDFLEALKKLLFSSSPEVVEWTLRTIEECGNQGVYFLPEFGKIKPPPWKWFNAHQRAVVEIITMLERRWSKFERPGT